MITVRGERISWLILAGNSLLTRSGREHVAVLRAVQCAAHAASTNLPWSAPTEVEIDLHQSSMERREIESKGGRHAHPTNEETT